MGWMLFFQLITPLYAQNFGTLVDELSGVEDDQGESEMLPSELPKAEEKPLPLPPSSNEIQATKAENSTPEDDFAPVKNVVTNGVTLQGLDKQTARVFIIDAHVGQIIEFGTLKLVVQHCEKAPLENRQESMAFIKITEQKGKSGPETLFSGWMFSSSPALSALDHPIYDVWVKECKVLD